MEGKWPSFKTYDAKSRLANSSTVGDEEGITTANSLPEHPAIAFRRLLLRSNAICNATASHNCFQFQEELQKHCLKFLTSATQLSNDGSPVMCHSLRT